MCKTDIRIRILKHYKKLNSSTSETKDNKWLHKLDSDLGTIRRALIELIESDYLAISEKSANEAVEWLKENMNSTTMGPRTPDHDDKKSSKRLIENIGNYNKVPEIRLYTKIKGIVFIQEYSRFKNKHLTQALFLIIAALIGFFSNYIFQLLKVAEQTN